MRKLCALLMVLGLVSAMSGCSERKAPVTTQPVAGQVIYAGKPAAGVRVYFLPTSAPTIPDIPSNPHGITDAEGRFSLTTFADGDGAAEGGYQVILLWPPEKAKTDGESDSDRFLGWYNAVYSTLTAQVKAGTNTLPPFRLAKVSAPPEAVNGIPGRN